MANQEPRSQQKLDSTVIPHWYDPDGDVLTINDGEGATVVDDNGDEYLDFVAQLYCTNAGYDDDRIVDAMTEQLNNVPYVSSSKHNDTRDELAGKLADIAPGRLSNVFFSISGSEANEAAIQIARAYADAPKVLTRYRSYHGGTYGAGSLTGDPETRSVLEQHAVTTGAVKFLPPIAHQSPFDADTPEELAEQASDHLEFVIKNEGPDSIAALLTEPIAGSSGAYPAPPGYFERVREICDKYDILLISDEVITGFGRCGDWFGIQTEDVQPDMITFAKGVTSAYAPLAGVIANDKVGEFVADKGFDIGQTFGGHPVSCAAGVAAIDAYEDGLIENTQALEPVVEKKLEALAADHDVVADVRGRGLLWAVEFADPETGEPFYDSRVDDGDNPVSNVAKEAQNRGVLFGVGRPSFQLLLSPPLCIDENDVEHAVAVLDDSISAVFD